MKNNGNAFFLILIAIVLFAALSFAISRSSRTTINNGDQEKANLIASQLIHYGNQIKVAVDRVMMMGGCDLSQISFERAPFDGTDSGFVNPNAPSDFHCHIFHPKGGNAFYERRQSNFNFESAVGITGVGTECVTSSCSDLFYATRLSSNSMTSTNSEKICDEINKITNNPAALSSQVIGDSSKVAFTGTMGYSATRTPIANDFSAFCTKETASHITFFRLLVAR